MGLGDSVELGKVFEGSFGFLGPLGFRSRRVCRVQVSLHLWGPEGYKVVGFILGSLHFCVSRFLGFGVVQGGA